MYALIIQFELNFLFVSIFALTLYIYIILRKFVLAKIVVLLFVNASVVGFDDAKKDD